MRICRARPNRRSESRLTRRHHSRKTTIVNKPFPRANAYRIRSYQGGIEYCAAPLTTVVRTRNKKYAPGYLAEKTSTFRAAFCAHQFQLAELSGTLAWRVVTPMHPSRCILQTLEKIQPGCTSPRSRRKSNKVV